MAIIQLRILSFFLFEMLLLMDLISCRPLAMIDLSYTFDDETPTYPPLHQPFESINRRTVSLGTLVFQTAEFYSSEHTGTHMDSPYHFRKEKLKLDELPLEIFEGPGVVLDITHKADLHQNPDALVELDDIMTWEKAHGPIQNGSIILMNSGWGKYARNRTIYAGGDLNSSQLHFPGFSEEACNFLTASRNVRAIGVDTLSADVGNSIAFPCHYIMSEVNGIILENVANVDQLPPTGSYIRAYPMKIKGGSGAPARIIATVDNPTHLPK